MPPNFVETVDKSAGSGIIEAGSDKVGTENDAVSAQSVLNKKKTEEIIQKGISLERPIFADDTFGEYAKHIPPEEGYYDVAMHGMSNTVKFFDTQIDDRTLAEIIKGRSDYGGGAVRLLSCNTGEKDETGECFAKRLSRRLGVEVKAPNKTLWVYKPNINGISKFSIGTTASAKDGDFEVFGNKGGD